MRPSLRAQLLAVILTLVAGLALGSATASAGIGDEGAADDSYLHSVPDIGTAQCSGSCAGPDNIFDVDNVASNLNWDAAGPLADWKSRFRQVAGSAPREEALEAKLSKKLGAEQCSNMNSSKCVLWHNVKSTDPWGYEIHKTRTKRSIGAGALYVWNIRIFRQDQPQPIFERRICGDDGKADDIGSPNWELRWYYCDKDNPDWGFSSSDKRLAGPLNPFNSTDKSNCNANWRSGENGERISKGPGKNGGTVTLSAASDARNPKKDNLWVDGVNHSGYGMPTCY
jgi:hypothetical protein